MFGKKVVEFSGGNCWELYEYVIKILSDSMDTCFLLDYCLDFRVFFTLSAMENKPRRKNERLCKAKNLEFEEK